MSGNVHLLDGVTLPKEPVAGVVEEIEALLALAKDGHIRAVALAGVYDDGLSHRTWAIEKGEGHSRLIGAVTRLQWCLTQESEA